MRAAVVFSTFELKQLSKSQRIDQLSQLPQSKGRWSTGIHKHKHPTNLWCQGQHTLHTLRLVTPKQTTTEARSETSSGTQPEGIRENVHLGKASIATPFRTPWPEWKYFTPQELRDSQSTVHWQDLQAAVPNKKTAANQRTEPQYHFLSYTISLHVTCFTLFLGLGVQEDEMEEHDCTHVHLFTKCHGDSTSNNFPCDEILSETLQCKLQQWVHQLQAFDHPRRISCGNQQHGVIHQTTRFRPSQLLAHEQPQHKCQTVDTLRLHRISAANIISCGSWTFFLRSSHASVTAGEKLAPESPARA